MSWLFLPTVFHAWGELRGVRKALSAGKPSSSDGEYHQVPFELILILLHLILDVCGVNVKITSVLVVSHTTIT